MKFDGRLEIFSSRTRWIIARAHRARLDGEAIHLSRSLAASKVDEWCDSATTWPDMVELYETLHGPMLFAPTAADIDDRIKPRLRRAFEDGTLVAMGSPLEQPKKDAEQGVHGQPTKIEPPEPPTPPRKPATPPKTLFSFAIRFVD